METKDIVLLVAGIVIGGLVSWLISHIFYVKASKSQELEFKKLIADIEAANTLEYFESQLKDIDWESRNINNNEIWVSTSNNSLQIMTGKDSVEFSEPWADKFPNPKSYSYSVYLKIANTTIKELQFISADGGRIFVPIPKVEIGSDSQRVFFWCSNSLEMAVCRIIGSFYIHKSIDGVATAAGIQIR